MHTLIFFQSFLNSTSVFFLTFHFFELYYNVSRDLVLKSRETIFCFGPLSSNFSVEKNYTGTASGLLLIAPFEEIARKGVASLEVGKTRYDGQEIPSGSRTGNGQTESGAVGETGFESVDAFGSVF